MTNTLISFDLDMYYNFNANKGTLCNFQKEKKNARSHYILYIFLFFKIKIQNVLRTQSEIIIRIRIRIRIRIKSINGHIQRRASVTLPSSSHVRQRNSI